MSKYQVLDYVSVLGNPRILSPEEKAKLDERYERMREIASAYKVTIITAQSPKHGENLPLLPISVQILQYIKDKSCSNTQTQSRSMM